MRAFLIMILVWFTLSSIGRLIWLARGRFPDRTAGETAVDSAIGLGVIVWASILLAGHD